MTINILKTRLDKYGGSPNGPLPDVRRVNIWPQIIGTKEAIPEEFKNTLDATALCDSPVFPYMIYIPDYHWEMSDRGFQYVNLKSILIVLDEDRVHIFKKSESKIISTTLKSDDICYIERGCILLFSWIRICGNNEGSSESMEFNTTAERTFDPIIEKLRSHYDNPINLSTGAEPKLFDHQKDISVKMWSYAYDVKKSFLPGQDIIDTAYQSRIYKLNIKKIRNLISYSHFIILTNKELILIKEEEEYGAFWKYIPLNRIENISFEEGDKSQKIFKEQKIFILSINLSNKEKISILFSPDNKSYVDSVMEKYENKLN